MRNDGRPMAREWRESWARLDHGARATSHGTSEPASRVLASRGNHRTRSLAFQMLSRDARREPLARASWGAQEPSSAPGILRAPIPGTIPALRGAPPKSGAALEGPQCLLARPRPACRRASLSNALEREGIRRRGPRERMRRICKIQLRRARNFGPKIQLWARKSSSERPIMDFCRGVSTGVLALEASRSFEVGSN